MLMRNCWLENFISINYNEWWLRINRSMRVVEVFHLIIQQIQVNGAANITVAVQLLSAT